VPARDAHRMQPISRAGNPHRRPRASRLWRGPALADVADLRTFARRHGDPAGRSPASRRPKTGLARPCRASNPRADPRRRTSNRWAARTSTPGTPARVCSSTAPRSRRTASRRGPRLRTAARPGFSDELGNRPVAGVGPRGVTTANAARRARGQTFRTALTSFVGPGPTNSRRLNRDEFAKVASSTLVGPGGAGQETRALPTEAAPGAVGG